MTRFYLYLGNANNKKLLYSLLILLVITMSGFLLINVYYGNGSWKMKNTFFHLQLASNEQDFSDIITSWIPKGTIDPDRELFRKIHGYITSLLVFDLLFPISYGLILMILIAQLSHRLYPSPSNWILTVFGLPLFAAIFDLLENSFHIKLLMNIESLIDLQNLSGCLITSAHFFSLIKFLLLGLSATAVLRLKTLSKNIT